MERVSSAIEGPEAPSSPRLFGEVAREYAHDAPTFDVVLPGGEPLRFRYIEGYDRLRAMQATAGEFADAVREGRCTRPFDPHREASRRALVWCHLLGSLSVASLEVGAGDCLAFLEFQKQNPVAWEYVREQVQARLSGVLDRAERRDILAAKQRIIDDPLWRNRLMVARDVWGRHPREQEGEPYRDAMMIDLIALALWEQESDA